MKDTCTAHPASWPAYYTNRAHNTIQPGPEKRVGLGLRMMAILALLTHNVIQKSTTLTSPIAGMLAPAGVATLSSAIVHILALWALPSFCVTMDPLAKLAAGIAVVAATWAIVVP